MRIVIRHPHRRREGLDEETIVRLPAVPRYHDYVYLADWDERLRVESVTFSPRRFRRRPLVHIYARKW